MLKRNIKLTILTKDIPNMTQIVVVKSTEGECMSEIADFCCAHPENYRGHWTLELEPTFIPIGKV